jgi:hypothetical protein
MHVRDSVTGLFYHAWDDSAAGSKAAWADANGRSPAIWGRAMGWYAMSLVDMLPDLPASTGRTQMLTWLTGIAAGLKTTQDPNTGLWYQVVDQGSKSDDWLETSGSGMFVYALKAAVNLGYIDSTYLTVATKGWQGLMAKVTTDSMGRPSITGAWGMGVQNNYAGYVAATLMPLLTDSPHGRARSCSPPARWKRSGRRQRPLRREAGRGPEAVPRRRAALPVGFTQPSSAFGPGLVPRPCRLQEPVIGGFRVPISSPGISFSWRSGLAGNFGGRRAWSTAF